MTKETKRIKPDWEDFTVMTSSAGVTVRCDLCRSREILGHAVYLDAPKKWARAHRKAGCRWTS